jgi:hypothetical protein
VVLLQNEYTQRMSCLAKIQSERKNKQMACGCLKNSGHWSEKLMKATFQNYDPNELIPVDKIKPNLQSKYVCSDSFVDDTNQAPLNESYKLYMYCLCTNIVFILQ